VNTLAASGVFDVSVAELAIIGIPLHED